MINENTLRACEHRAKKDIGLVLSTVAPSPTVTLIQFKSKWGLTYDEMAFVFGVPRRTIVRWSQQNKLSPISWYAMHLDFIWASKVISCYRAAGFDSQIVFESLGRVKKKDGHIAPGMAIFWEKIIYKVIAGDLPEINLFIHKVKRRRVQNC